MSKNGIKYIQLKFKLNDYNKIKNKNKPIIPSVPGEAMKPKRTTKVHMVKLFTSCFTHSGLWLIKPAAKMETAAINHLLTSFVRWLDDCNIHEKCTYGYQSSAVCQCWFRMCFQLFSSDFQKVILWRFLGRYSNIIWAGGCPESALSHWPRNRSTPWTGFPRQQTENLSISPGLDLKPEPSQQGNCAAYLCALMFYFINSVASLNFQIESKGRICLWHTGGSVHRHWNNIKRF